MLSALHIENIAVIRRADVDFNAGFSALTGETGAGKSMLIDSINLLLGNRFGKEKIRTGEDAAVVSAVFENLSPWVTKELEEMGFPLEDGSLMMWKTVRQDGKSIAKINGQTVSQSVQKSIAGLLVSIHGQSDSQKLLQKSAHLSLLDAYAHPEKELTDYQNIFERYHAKKQELDNLSTDESEKLRLQEMLQFQIADIDALKLKIGEEEAAEKERDRLLHLEKINQQTKLIYHLLSGGEKGNAVEAVRRAASALRGLSGIVENAEDLAERLSDAASELLDVSETVIGFADDSTGDPTAKIDKLESRLDAISKLKRKYGGSVEEILQFREKAALRLVSLTSSDELRSKLEQEVKKLRKEAETAAGKLRKIREKAAKEAEEKITEALSYLDMPKVRFSVRIADCELNQTGGDDVEFLVATNPGEPLNPLVRIASGGELSRLMLALRSVIDDKDGAGTVIFDEIDTGVSGKTSRKIGLKLSETAKNTQVICVTHSAQIASLADTHYQICKGEKDGRAETAVKLLSAEERVEEIARILGGIEVTSAQKEAAKEMIEEYRK